MRKGEEDEVDVAFGDEVPGEGLNGRLGAACAERELGVEGFEGDAAGRGLVGDATEEERLGVLEARVGEEQARELAAGVTAYAGDRGADGGDGAGCLRRVVSQGKPQFVFSGSLPFDCQGR